MKETYDDYTIKNKKEFKSLDDSRAVCERLYPQFKFWSLILKLELLVLSFVRSIRMGNFRLYKESLKSLLPWFFAIDHTSYSSWLPVHLVDMFQLEEINTDIATAFKIGMFMVNKTRRKCSSIDIDHPHDQSNKCVKGLLNLHTNYLSAEENLIEGHIQIVNLYHAK